MKRKVISILVTVLVMAALAGCGAKTEATEQMPESSEAVEADNVDETTDTEVGEETGADNTVSVGSENDQLVLFAETEEYGQYFELYTFDYAEQSGSVDTAEDVPIYNGDGINVGYIKAGADISITESATNGYWTRFENPIADMEYDYLYVMKDAVPELDPKAKGPVCSADEMRNKIIEGLDKFTVNEYTVLDTPASDMEVYEFIISNEESKISHRLREVMYEEIGVILYSTFAVECEEDADGEPYVHCRLYYKDPIDNDN